MASGEQTAVGGAVVDRLREDVARLLDVPVDDVGVDDDLVESGLDSVRMMSLVNEWNSGGIELSFADLVERPTIAAWAGVLSARPDEPARGASDDR